MVRILTLMLLLALPGACAPMPTIQMGELAADRPSDFTLGLVVYGQTDDATPPAQRSARYIVEPDGVLRASFGDGSRAMTHPPLTRRLDTHQLDALWARVREMGLVDGPWRRVRAPEQYDMRMGSGTGYLLELRGRVVFDAWSTPLETESAQALADHLASLSWVTD